MKEIVMTQKMTHKEAIENATLTAWARMFSNDGINHMLNGIIYAGMVWGYDNPGITNYMSVDFEDQEDLMTYGRSQLMEMFQAKRTFPQVVKDLFECAAAYNAQINAAKESK